MYFRIKTSIFKTNKQEYDCSLLGPPGRPEGPLEVAEVKAESVKLKWKKPKDDGGKDIM